MSAVEGSRQPADLSTCDDEPINLLGRVQSFGALLALSDDWTIVHASENIASILGVGCDDIIGRGAVEVFTTTTLDEIGVSLGWSELSGIAHRISAMQPFGDARHFDIATHITDGLIIVELEPAEVTPQIDPTAIMRSTLAKLRKTDDGAPFFNAIAHQFRGILGFDRVMVYQFLQDGSGEVIGESCADGVERFFGLRYPASDIPKQARGLYTKSLFRIIADVHDEGASIVPGVTSMGRPIDLSHSVLWAVSPIHREYLQNMQVGASLSISISIVVDGELWGLVACHHRTAQRVSFTNRSVAELTAELLALEIMRREQAAAAREHLRGQVLNDRILAQIAIEESTFEGLEPVLPLLKDLVTCDGVGLWAEGRYALLGDGPDESEIGSLVEFLGTRTDGGIFETFSLAQQFEPARAFASKASGVLAVRVSRYHQDHIFFFRRELVRAVTWAGNPDKAMSTTADGYRLSPRKSFKAWREIVRDTSSPWTARERQSAESLQLTLLEVILSSVEERMQLRKKAEETLNLLVGELNHRVRNILTLIGGIVRSSSSSVASIDEFASLIGGRIAALARAHDQLTALSWADAPLAELLRAEFAAYRGVGGANIALNGPDVLLGPTAFICLALVMHEMVTNAAKYGALSVPNGHVDVAWSLDCDAFLIIRWTETGGPLVSEPTRRGFGSSIVDRAIPFELHGTAAVEYAPEGVRAQFRVPLRYVRSAAASTEAHNPPLAAGPSEAGTVANQLGGTVLLLEDNVIIAMDAETMLLDLGFASVVLANSVEAALTALQDQAIYCAILDVNLGEDTSVAVAEVLLRTGIRFIFATGYGDAVIMPEGLQDVPIITKPYASAQISSAFGRALP